MSPDRSFLRRLGVRGEPEPARSARLTFEYDEAGVRLVRRILREKAAPPGRDLSSPPPPDGFWVEVRAGGDVVYRRVLPEPIRQSAEVFDPGGRIGVVPHAPASGVFSVVVPAPAKPAIAVVVAGPEAQIAQPGLQAGPAERGRARELVRVPLGEG